jgi:WD40 repeat protein
VQFQGEESNLHSDLIRSAAWSSDGTHLATVGDDKVVKLWLVQEGRTYHYQGETQYAVPSPSAPSAQCGLAATWPSGNSPRRLCCWLVVVCAV